MAHIKQKFTAPPLILASLLCFAFGEQVFANEIPLSYAGRLAEANGRPFEGPIDLTVKFYRSETGNSQVGAALTVNGVELQDGVFQIPLSLSTTELDTLLGDGTEAVYIEVTARNLTMARQRFMPVPLALRVPVDNSTLVFDSNTGKLKVGTISTSQISGLQSELNKVGGITFDTSGTRSNGDVMKWDGSKLVFGPAIGAQGIQGLQGPQGAQGAVGSQILTGSGAPGSGVGVLGDFYIDTASGNYYSKASGGWGLSGNLTGPTGATGPQGIQGNQGVQGLQGIQGIQGVPGSQLLTGSVAPTAGTGTISDFYLDTATGDYYVKTSPGWGSSVGNLRGPQGLQGIQGPVGPTGPQGPAGSISSVTGAGVISVANPTTAPSISISQATTSSDGYLSSADWNTFNSKVTTASVTAVSDNLANNYTNSATLTTLLSGKANTTNVSNWDTAYSDRMKWDGGATDLNATTGRASLGLGTAATLNAGTAVGEVVTVQTGAKLPVLDGSNLTNVTDASRVAKAGDTMSGTLNLPADGLVAGTNQLVLSGGNVGIGTTAPANKLEVAGIIKSTTGGITFPDGTTQTTSAVSSTCRTGYVLVPKDSKFTFNDFCVMKYEAKKDAATGLATSVAAGSPWISISWYSAKDVCQRVGAHLITEGEWVTIARNIEANANNDIDGAGGIQLATGHSDGSPAMGFLASDGVDPYYGTGDSSAVAYSPGASGKSQKRTHELSNSNILWDIAGNVGEWTDMQCDGTVWYSAAAWTEWSDSNLTDWEKLVAGPNGSLTSTNGAGKYYGCAAAGNAMVRGGNRNDVAASGVFAALLAYPPANVYTSVGFRCSYAP